MKEAHNVGSSTGLPLEEGPCVSRNEQGLKETLKSPDIALGEGAFSAGYVTPRDYKDIDRHQPYSRGCHLS